jgi:hypothetical protein
MNKENKALLNKIYRDNLIKENPSFPERYLPDYKNTDNSTNGLTRCVVDFLNYSGHFAERISNTGRYIAGETIDGVNGKFTTQGKFIKGNGVNGRADISAKIKLPSMRYAIPVEIEIKFAKDRMSAKQKEYQTKMDNVGAEYWVVRTFDDFIIQYNTLCTSSTTP